MSDRETPTLFADPAAAPPEPAELTEPVAAEAPPVVEAPMPCPRCGAPLRADQEWCLNCGAAARTQIAAPSGWRAPVAIVAAVLTVALAGLVVAFLAISDDSDELTKIAQNQTQTQALPGQPQQPPATAPAPTAAPATTAAPDPAASATPVPTITPAPDEPGASTDTPVPDPADPGASPQPGDPNATTSPSPGIGTGTTAAIGKWPAGKDAFTVVLLSSPTRSGARKRAKQLAAGGTEVGILHSDDFSSLRSGYWVVFSGQYDTRDAAESAVSGLKGESPSAYVRKVTPR